MIFLTFDTLPFTTEMQACSFLGTCFVTAQHIIERVIPVQRFPLDTHCHVPPPKGVPFLRACRKAGQRLFENPLQIPKNWIPAFAGMTRLRTFHTVWEFEIEHVHSLNVTTQHIFCCVSHHAVCHGRETGYPPKKHGFSTSHWPVENDSCFFLFVQHPLLYFVIRSFSIVDAAL